VAHWRGSVRALDSSAPVAVRIETLPLILGILIALLGIGIIVDAWTPDGPSVAQDRRRRPRIERHRNGEALIGLGVLGLAAAFIGRDSWRYSVLAVIIGAVFLLVGAILNGRYVRELFVNRGPLRRREATPDATTAPLRADEPRVIEPARAADAPDAASRNADWDGVERRQTPREGEPRRSSRRGPP
jgi:hypothetical protein